MFYRVTRDQFTWYFENESHMWIWIEALDYLNDPVTLTIEICTFET